MVWVLWVAFWKYELFYENSSINWIYFRIEFTITAEQKLILIWNLKQELITVKYFHVLKFCEWCHYNKMWHHDTNACHHIWFSFFFFSIWSSLRYSSWIFVVSMFHYFICWYNQILCYLARFQLTFNHMNLGKIDQDLLAIMFIALYGLITKNLIFKYVINFCKVIVKVSYSDVITALLFFVALCNFSYLNHIHFVPQVTASEIYKVFFISQQTFCCFRHN